MQTKDTHNRDNGYNSDLRTEVEALSRRFNELEMVLRNYLEEANDEKIKSNRRLQDTLYNLDDENIPSLPGIIKISKEGYEMAGLIAEVNENGEVVAKASVIVEAINNGDSKVSINANKIALNGEVTLSSWCADDDVTVINGGKIKAKTITADQIDASNLKVETAAIAESMVIHDAEGNTLFSAADNNVIIAGFTVEGNYMQNLIIKGEGDQTESTLTILSENGFSQSYTSYGAEDFVSISSGGITLGLVGHGDYITRPYPFMGITFDNDVFYNLYLDFETNTVKFS